MRLHGAKEDEAEIVEELFGNATLKNCCKTCHAVRWFSFRVMYTMKGRTPLKLCHKGFTRWSRRQAAFGFLCQRCHRLLTTAYASKGIKLSFSYFVELGHGSCNWRHRWSSRKYHFLQLPPEEAIIIYNYRGKFLRTSTDFSRQVEGVRSPVIGTTMCTSYVKALECFETRKPRWQITFVAKAQPNSSNEWGMARPNSISRASLDESKTFGLHIGISCAKQNGLNSLASWSKPERFDGRTPSSQVETEIYSNVNFFYKRTRFKCRNRLHPTKKQR